MGKIIKEHMPPSGKTPPLAPNGRSGPPGNGLQREAEKTKTTSAFITRIYHHFDVKSSLQDLDSQFLHAAQDLLGVDGAAILVKGANGDGYTLRTAEGMMHESKLSLNPAGLPILGPVELYYRNSDTPPDEVGQCLLDATGMPYVLWARHVDGNLALLLGKELEEAREHPPFTDNSGHVAYSALQVYSDLLEKREAHRESFESELRFRTMMENIPAGIFRVSREGRLLRSNPALATLLGYENVDRLGDRSIWDYYSEPAEGKAVIQELLEKGAVLDREVLLKRIDDSEVWASTTVRAVRGRDGRILCFDGSVVDIDHRKKMEQQLHESYLLATEALQGTVQAIMRMAELRDPYTAGHQERVAQLARAIARELGVEENRAQGVFVAGILHDVGKIYVPSEILNKPGKITELEHSVLKTHVEVGYEVLRPVRFPWPVAEAVYQHHERLDGSGYPRGLTEPEIILEARILGVADVVEAMLSHRPYRPGLGLERALEEIQSKSGTVYDASVVEACVHLFRNRGFEFR